MRRCLSVNNNKYAVAYSRAALLHTVEFPSPHLTQHRRLIALATYAAAACISD
jgi:hypothetical protein